MFTRRLIIFSTLFAATALISVIDAFGQTASLKINFPEGRIAHYKNTFSLRYDSDSADKLLTGRDTQGNVMILSRGEWRSAESAYTEVGSLEDPFEDGEQGIEATLSKADNSLEFQGVRLAARQLPIAYDDLNGKKFGWRLSEDGETRFFHPKFKAYELPNRSLIPELYQLWMPGVCPMFPEGEVEQGDTWTGEQAILDGQTARVKLNSTYKVKAIKEKKGSTIVKLEENREVEYIYVINSGAVLLIVNGTGSGRGEWEIDATKGVVLKHKMETDIERPTVSRSDAVPISEVRADVRINFKRELQKLEE